MKKKTKFWAKHHEILGGSWVNIPLWKYIWFNIVGNITCISEGYPSLEKDRGFAHSAPRQEY
jgi:hypothetical protein